MTNDALSASFWTEDRLTRAKRWWENGWSAAQIAATFNAEHPRPSKTCTRSMVLGQVNRRDWTGPQSGRGHIAQSQPVDGQAPATARAKSGGGWGGKRIAKVAKAPKARTSKNAANGFRGKAAETQPPMPVPDAGPVLASTPKPLNMLRLQSDFERNECRWPYGDGPFLFCSSDTSPGAVYCPFHTHASVHGTDAAALRFGVPRETASTGGRSDGEKTPHS